VHRRLSTSKAKYLSYSGLFLLASVAVACQPEGQRIKTEERALYPTNRLCDVVRFLLKAMIANVAVTKISRNVARAKPKIQEKVRLHS
jgi:hypothetical protein